MTLKVILIPVLLLLLTFSAAAQFPTPEQRTRSSRHPHPFGRRAAVNRQFDIVATTPAKAVAQCRDGTFGFGARRRNACQGHGGVARWLQQEDE
jgi:hypothetical protein